MVFSLNLHFTIDALRQGHRIARVLGMASFWVVERDLAFLNISMTSMSCAKDDFNRNAGIGHSDGMLAVLLQLAALN